MPDPSSDVPRALPWLRRALFGVSAFLTFLFLQAYLTAPTHRFLLRQAEELDNRVLFLESVETILLPEFRKKLRGLPAGRDGVQRRRLEAKVRQYEQQVVERGLLGYQASRKRAEADEWAPRELLLQGFLSVAGLWVLFCLSRLLLIRVPEGDGDPKSRARRRSRHLRAALWTAFPLAALLLAARGLLHLFPAHDEWIENVGPLAVGFLLAGGVKVYAFRLEARARSAFGSEFWRLKETPLGRSLDAVWKAVLSVLLTFLSGHPYAFPEKTPVFEARRAARYVAALAVCTLVLHGLGGLSSYRWETRADTPPGMLAVLLLLAAVAALWVRTFHPRLWALPGRKRLICPLCSQEASTFLNRFCGTCGAFISRWGEKLETPFETRGWDRVRVMWVGLCLGLLSVVGTLLVSDAAWRGVQALADRAARHRLEKAGFYEAVRRDFPRVPRFAFRPPKKDLVWAHLVQSSVDAKAFRRARGRWPVAVWELERETGRSTLYRDPYTGGRLKVLAVDGGIVLYSVGPDRSDDQGASYDPGTGRGDMLVRLKGI
jgi:hypothetical protein